LPARGPHTAIDVRVYREPPCSSEAGGARTQAPRGARRLGSGQILAEYWSNTGQILVKYWPNAHRRPPQRDSTECRWAASILTPNPRYLASMLAVYSLRIRDIWQVCLQYTHSESAIFGKYACKGWTGGGSTSVDPFVPRSPHAILWPQNARNRPQRQDRDRQRRGGSANTRKSVGSRGEGR
jgi:hypothetical protein